MRCLRHAWLVSIAGASLFASDLHAATIQVVNADPVGVGFNDPTLASGAAPGNTGTTIGERKLKVVQWAAAKLGSLLYSPVPIVVEVSHDASLYCEANAATLAAAGPAWLMRSNRPLVADHPDVPTWYPSALYHRLTGTRYFSEDVTAVFNPELGSSNCMDGFEWYYGLDNDPPDGNLPFVDTVLHELTHGLGFTAMTGNDGLISELDPESISPYFAYALDRATGKHWWNMTAEERVVSSTSGLLVWTGPATKAAANGVVTAPLDEHGHLYMYAPGTYEQGSSLSHFDEATSPDLLMEPFANNSLNVIDNDIDLGREFLQDIGWRDAECGNGVVDPPEECDLGDDNDENADAIGECDTSCRWYVVDDCPEDPNKTTPGVCGCGVPDSDQDGDGTEDCNDACPADGAKTEPGLCGCGIADTDQDGDGVPNCLDGCPLDASKAQAGICGCGVSDKDSDGDQTADCFDECPDDASKIEAGECGCGEPETDADGDATPDCLDQCPHDPAKTQPGMCGCGASDDDSDGDTVIDCLDGCPNDAGKVQPLICGCGVADFDSDGDGTVDCVDACPTDGSKIEAGHCGCGVSDRDRDGDGVPDCDDRCADDPLKTAPGACGCGTPDVDTDGDGVPDCQDACRQDPNKTSTGICGCGVSDRDRDGDGVADCDDGCPDDPAKTSPGECGCGAADSDVDGDGSIDCSDACPRDPNKTAPGACGCGTPDLDRDMDGTSDCNDGCPDDGNKLAEGICGCGESDRDRDGDGVADCMDACPTQAGLPSEDGCLPELDDRDPPDDGDAGAPTEGDELQALLSDGGIDRDELDKLLGDAGADSDDIRDRLLQRALDELTADGGAQVKLNLALPDSCQCTVVGARHHGPNASWAWWLAAAGLVWVRRRRTLPRRNPIAHS